MDEFDEGLSPEGDDIPEAPEPIEPPSPDAKLKKLQNENRSLRTRLRRSELEAKHGKTVADLIPDEVPLTKWDEYAEKLAAFASERPEERTAGQEAEVPKEEPTPDEQKLAAATGATSGAGAATVEMTPREIRELGKADPVRAMQQIKAQYRAQ